MMGSDNYSAPASDDPPAHVHPDAPDDVADAIEHMPRWDICDVRHVLEYGAARRIDGTLCDLFSSSVIVQVFDMLSDESQARALRMPFGRFGSLCWSITTPKG